MGLSRVNASHIRLICLYQTRYALRGGAGLVFLMITLVFGLTVAQAVLAPVEKMMAEQAKAGGTPNPEGVIDTILEFGRPVIQWALGVESEDANVTSGLSRGKSLARLRPKLIAWLLTPRARMNMKNISTPNRSKGKNPINILPQSNPTS